MIQNCYAAYGMLPEQVDSLGNHTLSDNVSFPG